MRGEQLVPPVPPSVFAVQVYPAFPTVPVPVCVCPQAFFGFILIIPYFFLFATLAGLHRPGTQRWRVFFPVLGGCVALATTLHTIFDTRTPGQFGAYSGAMHALNVFNLFSVAILVLGLGSSILTAFDVAVPGAAKGWAWQTRADLNRHFVAQALVQIEAGVDTAEKPARPSYWQALKELLRNPPFKASNQTQSPVFLPSSLVIGSVLGLFFVVLTACALFTWVADQSAELQSMADSMGRAFQPSEEDVQELQEQFNVTLTHRQLAFIYSRLQQSRAGKTTQRVATVVEGLATAFAPSAVPCIVLTTVLLLCQVPCTLLSYVKLVREFRLLQRPVLWDMYSCTAAAPLVANSWVVAFTGCLTLSLALTACVLLFTWNWLFQLWWQYSSFIVAWLTVWLVQTVFMRMVLARQLLSYSGAVERFPTAFAVLMYTDCIISLLTSITVGVFRLLYVLGLSCLYYMRMDYCVFPEGPLQFFDPVWWPWYSTIVRHEIANNPFIDVFRDVLCQQALGIAQDPSQCKSIRPIATRDEALGAEALSADEVREARELLLQQSPWLQQFGGDARPHVVHGTDDGGP